MSSYIYPTLQWIAATRKGPTVTARFLFLVSSVMMLTECSLMNLPFTVDDILALTSLSTPSDDAVRLAVFNNVCTMALQPLFPGARFPPVVAVPQWSSLVLTLLQQANTFLQARANDGSASSMPVPLPNGDRVIEPGVPLGAALPDPLLWTPLKVDGNVQSFLTPQWGYVRNVISNDDATLLLTVADHLFPTPPQREKEIDELLALEYSNSERMSAEFWAGGPGTVTPPGIWALFCIKAMETLNFTWSRQVCVHFLLSAALFQSSITAWRIKRDKMQQRPIQAIMQRPPSIVRSWNGMVDTSVWLPYQELDFVTPPFPDYISGHSTFSGAGSTVLSECLGALAPSEVLARFSREELLMLSPIFSNSPVYDININSPSSISFAPNISRIDAEYPYTTICFNYSSWKDMAADCGKSRIYGGIHTQSANGAGLIIGDSIAKVVLDNYLLFNR